jgi:hypothetical protein
LRPNARAASARTSLIDDDVSPQIILIGFISAGDGLAENTTPAGRAPPGASKSKAESTENAPFAPTNASPTPASFPHESP